MPNKTKAWRTEQTAQTLPTPSLEDIMKSQRLEAKSTQPPANKRPPRQTPRPTKIEKKEKPNIDRKKMIALELSEILIELTKYVDNGEAYSIISTRITNILQ